MHVQQIQQPWNLGRKTLGLNAMMLLYGFLGAFAFDYHNQRVGVGGSYLPQYVMLAVTAFCAAAFCLTDKQLPSSQSLTRYTTIWFVFLFVQMLQVLFYGSVGLENIDWTSFLKAVLPFLNTTLALCVTQVAIRKGLSPVAFVNILAVVVPLACLFRVVFALVIARLDADSVRYQAQNPALVFCLAYGLSTFFITDKVRLLGYFNIGTFLFIVLLTVTRSFIFVVSAALICATVVAVGVRLQGYRVNIMKRGYQLVLVAIAMLLAVSILLVVRPNAFKTWQERTSGRVWLPIGERDMSTEIRLAEFKGEIRKLLSNPVVTLIGANVAGTSIDDTTWAIELQIIPRYNVPLNDASDGDLVYILFAGGIIFGGFMLGSIVFFIWKASKATLMAARMQQPEVIFVLATIVIYFVACTVFQISWSLYTERFASLLHGIIMGITLVLYDRIKASSTPLPVPAPSIESSALLGY